MPLKLSAGLLMYRFHNETIEVLLGHPGGPYYTEKDDGYWGIPKGGAEGEERLMETAVREFNEETGLIPDLRNIIPLGSVLQDDNKIICIWAFQGNCIIPSEVDSNLFELEWPEGSGCVQAFPEVDKIDFFPIKDAIVKIEPVQREFVLRLQNALIIKVARLPINNRKAAM
jgi:predicted NUDIX family NTP pyrophosphohydrolase